MIPHSKPDLSDAEIDAAAAVLRSGMLAQGREVRAFEEECAARVGRGHAVALSSGTAALHLALTLLGVRTGDRVAIPSYVCAALLQAVTFCRARPVLVDVDADFNFDPARIPPGCKAAIVAHLFGKTSRIPDAVPLVIEDLAHSIGGGTGRAGVAAVASFYATKMITTGEGGMLLTDDPALAEAARDRRDYDGRESFVPRFPYKMTDLQAAIGRVQLRRLPGFLERRREIAEVYGEAFRGLPLGLPNPAGHLFFRYAVTTPRRDALQGYLRGRGIEAKRPVYKPLHQYVGGHCPVSERAHNECLSIPAYPALVDKNRTAVLQSVLSFFDSAADR